MSRTQSMNSVLQTPVSNPARARTGTRVHRLQNRTRRRLCSNCTDKPIIIGVGIGEQATSDESPVAANETTKGPFVVGHGCLN